MDGARLRAVRLSAAAGGHGASPGSAQAARGRGSHASASPGGILAACGSRAAGRLHLRAGTGLRVSTRCSAVFLGSCR